MECQLNAFLKSSFRYLKGGLLLIVLFLPKYCFATSPQECPRVIEVNQEAASTYSNWRVLASKANHRFRRMSFKVRAELGELRSDNEKFTKGGIVSHWDFPPNQEIEQVCEYSGTLVKLVRKIDAKSCDILDKSENHTFISLKCKT